MRRALALGVLSALVAASAVTAKPAPPSWAQPEIKTVVGRGLMGKDVASFRPDDPLTQGELAALVSKLTGKAVAAPADPHATVTIAQLNARLVGVAGLSPAAGQFLRGARDAGLAPPSRFGTETVARLLGLRTNHPAGKDGLELHPNDPASRAETAYSAARMLRLGDSETTGVEAAAEDFTLPALTAWQKRVLSTASRLIGYPYVWGGTSDTAQSLFGGEVPGGFDCSGFVWRVYKVQSYPGAPGLAKTIKGRTAAAMGGEVPAARRIPLARIAPGDLLFFGNGPRSKPAQIDHMGIALGNGWMIHSSRYGVALVTLEGWYRDRFAWARRPIAEAGLGGGFAAPLPPDPTKR